MANVAAGAVGAGAGVVGSGKASGTPLAAAGRAGLPNIIVNSDVPRGGSTAAGIAVGTVAAVAGFSGTGKWHFTIPDGSMGAVPKGPVSLFGGASGLLPIAGRSTGIELAI
ncbi:MAG: hypothetical protein ABSD13_10175 [Candidatus Korobacteraceae bacterium]